MEQDNKNRATHNLFFAFPRHFISKCTQFSIRQSRLCLRRSEHLFEDFPLYLWIWTLLICCCYQYGAGVNSNSPVMQILIPDWLSGNFFSRVMTWYLWFPQWHYGFVNFIIIKLWWSSIWALVTLSCAWTRWSVEGRLQWETGTMCGALSAILQFADAFS